MFVLEKELVSSEEGTAPVWKTVKDAPGLELLVTSNDNANFQEAVSRAQTERGGDDVPIEELMELTAEHLLHGWRGLALKEGSEELFSKKRAMELFKLYRRLWVWTTEAAGSVTGEDVRRAAETAKN